MATTGRPFTASTSKLAYAQAFSSSRRDRHEHRSLRSLLGRASGTRRDRARSV